MTPKRQRIVADVSDHFKHRFEIACAVERRTATQLIVLALADKYPSLKEALEEEDYANQQAPTPAHDSASVGED